MLTILFPNRLMMIDPRVSTIEAADRKDENPPYDILTKLLAEQETSDIEHKSDGGKCTVFWMRLNDLRRKLILLSGVVSAGIPVIVDLVGFN